MSDECWREVVGYEGLYEVSDHGQVRSLDRIVNQVNRWGSVNRQHRKSVLLKQTKKSNAYMQVGLYREGVFKSALVHRLVAEAFIRSMLPLEQVNHIDGDHGNNNIANLEICSAKENSLHSVRTGLYPFGDRNGSRIHKRPSGDNNPASKLTSKDIALIKSLRADGKTLREISSHFPVGISSISNVLRGNTWRG